MQNRFLTVLIFICTALSSPGMASGGAEPAKDPHAAPAADAPPAPVGPRREYNPGPTTPFPEKIEGVNLINNNPFTLSPIRGRALMAIFIASWCEPCQQLMSQIKTVSEKYSNVYTDVVFIFAHDTLSDARGFAKEHKLTGNLTLATHNILKEFKNPELPAVYVSDRYKYMGNRFLKMTSDDIVKLETYMSKLTAL